MKKIYKNVKDCCTHYNGTKKYFAGKVLGIFNVLVCEDCETVIEVSNKIKQILFSWIGTLFWKGTVKVFPNLIYIRESEIIRRV